MQRPHRRAIAESTSMRNRRVGRPISLARHRPERHTREGRGARFEACPRFGPGVHRSSSLCPLTAGQRRRKPEAGSGECESRDGIRQRQAPTIRGRAPDGRGHRGVDQVNRRAGAQDRGPRPEHERPGLEELTSTEDPREEKRAAVRRPPGHALDDLAWPGKQADPEREAYGLQPLDLAGCRHREAGMPARAGLPAAREPGALRRSAKREAKAMIVRAGLALPWVGITLPSATNRFGSPQTR